MAETTTTPGAPAVDAKTADYARRWLREHHLAGIEPTPLLAARLRARRRSKRQLVAAAIAIVVVLSVIVPEWRASADLSATNRRLLFFSVAINVVVVLAVWWILRGQRRADRQIAAVATRRAAHPVRFGWREVVGPWHAASTVASYTAALLVTAVVATVARSAQDRLAALTSMLGVVVCAGIVAAALVDVLRRPALAEDPASLAVDDVLRTKDARAALSGAPVAAIVALPNIAGPPLNWWLFAGFVAVALAASAAAGLKEPTARPMTRPTTVS